MLCFRWKNHGRSLIRTFKSLLETEKLVDCTLVAEGKCLKAHKMILCACSPYFASLLQEQYDQHPLLILEDVKYHELLAIMDYMYRGEIIISQPQLKAFLRAAESLQIKGLSRVMSGSREDSLRTHLDNGAPDKSDFNALQVCSNQYIPQQPNARIAASVLASTHQPMTSSIVSMKTESPKLTSSTAATATANGLRQLTSDANNNWNVQPQSQDAQGTAWAWGAFYAAVSGAGASAGVVHSRGVVVEQLAVVVDRSSPNYKQKVKDNSVRSEVMAADIHLMEQAQGPGNSNKTLTSPNRIGCVDEPLYECSQCGKKYRWKSTLRRHENWECGGKEPSNQCPYCQFKTRQHGNLRSHMKRRHSQFPELDRQRRSKNSKKYGS